MNSRIDALDLGVIFDNVEFMKARLVSLKRFAGLSSKPDSRSKSKCSKIMKYIKSDNLEDCTKIILPWSLPFKIYLHTHSGRLLAAHDLRC